MWGVGRMNSFLLICSLIGTTLIVVRSTLFRRVRRVWPELLGCSQCTGMWIGAGAGASGLITFGYWRPLDAMLVGTATSFLAILADAVLIDLLGDPLDHEDLKNKP
jgi:hypothetical protein